MMVPHAFFVLALALATLPLPCGARKIRKGSPRLATRRAHAQKEQSHDGEQPFCGESPATNSLCKLSELAAADVCVDCARGHRSSIPKMGKLKTALSRVLQSKVEGDPIETMRSLLPLVILPPGTLDDAALTRAGYTTWHLPWWFAEACTEWVTVNHAAPGTTAEAVATDCLVLWEQAFVLASDHRKSPPDRAHQMKLVDGREQLRVVCSLEAWQCAPPASAAGSRLPPLPQTVASSNTAKLQGLASTDGNSIRIVDSFPDKVTWGEIIRSQQPVLFRGFSSAGISNWAANEWLSEIPSEQYHIRAAQVIIRLMLHRATRQSNTASTPAAEVRLNSDEEQKIKRLDHFFSGSNYYVVSVGLGPPTVGPIGRSVGRSAGFGVHIISSCMHECM